jgi:hypothetical protein
VNLQALIIAVIGALVFLGLMELYNRWRHSRIVSRALERARHPERYASEPPARLEPESRFIVRLSDSEVVCDRPDGKTERVTWSDLQRVEIVTTSDGPMLPDVFWVLHGTESGCAIPQGATGEKELLDRLHALPGFDNGQMIQAMCCADDRRFLCWQRAA